MTSGNQIINTRRAAGLVFITALVALALQVLTARIVSAKLLNNYAFFVISLTMLGFAVSGVALSRNLSRYLERFDEMIGIFSSLFVITALVVTALFYHAGLNNRYTTTQINFIREFLNLMPYAMVYALPFVFSGLIIGLLLSMPRLDARQIYGFDLAGSACGALGVLAAISHWGVETSLLVICAVQLVGSILLAPPRRRSTFILLAIAGLTLVGVVAGRQSFFQMRYASDSILGYTQMSGSGYELEQVMWDPAARIELTRIPSPDPERESYPVLTGDNRKFLASFKKVITQNNFAFTYALDYRGNPATLEGIDQTIYAAAYQASIVPKPKVGIVGVGGGFDILTALYFQASDITAAEINSATVKILKKTDHEYFKAWVDDPRVHLMPAEGRAYLSGNPQCYDVLQLSGVDSFSGTPGSANVFSESYLYTSEAFDLYLSRLTENGILNMMRLEYQPPREMLRALVTAVGALRRAGIADPAKHIIMLTARKGNFTALLVKKTPFNEKEEAQVTRWAGTNKFLEISAAPRRNSPDKTFYETFLSLNDSAAEKIYLDICPFNISPATDDKPFFFRFSFWKHLWPESPLIASNPPALEISLLLLTLLILVMAGVCVWLPLRLMRSTENRSSARRRFGLFFASIGLGYMAVEIALLQKFGLFLGHPNYALSVVLAGLLLATGIGALFSQPLLRALGGIRKAACFLVILLLIEEWAVLPHLLSWMAWPFILRVLTVIILIFPLGMLMGVFAPTALQNAKEAGYSEDIPWLWGINGIFSVLAPVLSVAWSVTAGISALLLSAVPIYLIAGFILPRPRSPDKK